MAAVGAVVLAGGRSSRMGRAKADLEWHGSTLLRRTVGVVARAVDGPVVVVRAQDQRLPPLPSGVTVVDDSRPGRGPLQAVADGLAALGAEAGFVCSTDLPFLHPVFVRRVVAALGPDDVALPHVGGFPQPLAAVYRTALAPAAADLVARGQSRLTGLLDGAAVGVLDDEALLDDERLRRVDPHLDSVLGVNDLPSYERARARPAPEVVVERAGAAFCTVRAATLGLALQSAGVPPDDAIVVCLDGRVVRDRETPLAQGDLVTLRPAGTGA